MLVLLQKYRSDPKCGIGLPVETVHLHNSEPLRIPILHRGQEKKEAKLLPSSRKLRLAEERTKKQCHGIPDTPNR